MPKQECPEVKCSCRLESNGLCQTYYFIRIFDKYKHIGKWKFRRYVWGGRKAYVKLRHGTIEVWDGTHGREVYYIGADDDEIRVTTNEDWTADNIARYLQICQNIDETRAATNENKKE